MGLLVGQTPWWQANIMAACPVGTTLPDGSRIICKAGGTAWIVAPVSTQVNQTWNGTTNALVGDKCCVCDWSTLCSRMVSCGFNPSDWFVPSSAQLQNPGYVCRTRWDSYGGSDAYWSSTESNDQCAIRVLTINGGTQIEVKTASSNNRVRAFRCVTY